MAMGENRNAGEHVRCPVSLCRWQGHLVVELAQPNPTGYRRTALRRIPLHALGSDALPASTNCPASLMQYPLSAEVRQALDEQEASLLKLIQPAPKLAAPKASGPREGRESAAPGSNWFRNSEEPKRPTPGYLGYPVMEPTPLPGPEPEKRARLTLIPGGSMDGSTEGGSVGDLRALVAQIIGVVAEVRELVARADGRGAEALALANHLREGSGREIGAGALAGVVASLESAIGSIDQAMRELAEYGGSL